MSSQSSPLDRRSFLKIGAMSTGAAIGCGALVAETPRESAPCEMKYRPLGDTGLRVSEVSFGTYGFDNPALLSAALDAGINLVCTCADYQDGRAEEAVGRAIEKIGSRRDELVIFTGMVGVRKGTTRKQILSTLDASLRRLRTDRVEIFRASGVVDPGNFLIEELFEAFATAKKAGKILHLGLSGHKGGLQDCLNAAIDDGRMKAFLIKYDFMSYPDQDPILRRAREKGIGTIVFKTNAGARQKEIKDLEAGGLSLTQATTKWALSNPEVASVCAGITNFDQIREYCGAVGEGLSKAEIAMMHRYADVMRDRYCRFCATCEKSCPHNVAVAEVMRYAMYFKYYGREKDAMSLYGSLPRERTARACDGCAGDCEGNCPFGRRIREELREAHAALSFA
jgi:aryl-alcohol dehydrogenase-like predicted oxidoreductase